MLQKALWARLETGLPHVYTTAKRWHTHIKDPVVHVKGSVDYKNAKITWHALKVSISKMLKLDAVQKKRTFPREKSSTQLQRVNLGKTGQSPIPTKQNM